MIPKYCNQFVFALWSMFAYWVIIMTYFGVNYFLTGLHSYAAGEAAQIPNYVYWGFALMVVLAFFARRKRNLWANLNEPYFFGYFLCCFSAFIVFRRDCLSYYK